MTYNVLMGTLNPTHSLTHSRDEAAPLFDVHNEPVHCPAERCKLSYRLSVTPAEMKYQVN